MTSLLGVVYVAKFFRDYYCKTLKQKQGKVLNFDCESRLLENWGSNDMYIDF